MTSIEWLIDQLMYKSEFEHSPNNYFLMNDKDIDKIIEQAKEMHKEEMSDSYQHGWFSCEKKLLDNEN